jgi:hypothetical protein
MPATGCGVGGAVGLDEGSGDGRLAGDGCPAVAAGVPPGFAVGRGLREGLAVAPAFRVGFAVALAVGLAVGFAVGFAVGTAVGFGVGVAVGFGLGVGVGFGVGGGVAVATTNVPLDVTHHAPFVRKRKTYVQVPLGFVVDPL